MRKSQGTGQSQETAGLPVQGWKALVKQESFAGFKMECSVGYPNV